MQKGLISFAIKPSQILLFLSGVSLLVSLPLLQSDELGLWVLSKALYGIGVVLFLLDK